MTVVVTALTIVTLVAVLRLLPVLVWDVLTMTPTEIGETDDPSA